MATKKKTSTPQSDLGKAALQLALNVLKSEAVRDQLMHAPQAAVTWARERRALQSKAPRREEKPSPSKGPARSDGPSTEAERSREPARRLSPADRFGQRGLERRIERLDAAVALAFGGRATTTRPEVWMALDELRTSVAVAGGLPMLKRKRMHMRIDDALDELELGLMDALLPKN